MVLNKCWETKRDSKQKHNQIMFEMSLLIPERHQNEADWDECANNKDLHGKCI